MRPAHNCFRRLAAFLVSSSEEPLVTQRGQLQHCWRNVRERGDRGPAVVAVRCYMLNNDGTEIDADTFSTR